MPNIGGPKQEKSWLLMKVVTSIAIYAAPMWAGAMDKRTYIDRNADCGHNAPETCSGYREDETT